jgi:hypothetical protein
MIKDEGKRMRGWLEQSKWLSMRKNYSQILRTTL